MSWQLFVVIQTALFSAAALTAIWLHNLRLRRQNGELTRLCLAAHDELVNVTDKLKDMETTASPEKMLEQRIKGMAAGDATTQVRRLVLENEIKPVADFEERLMGYLAVEEPEEQDFVKRWRSVRAECQQLAMFLVVDNPTVYAAITQLFEVIEPLDALYDVQLEPLVAPEDKPADSVGEADSEGDPDATAAQPDESGAGGAPDSGAEELDQAALDALLANTRSASS